MSSLQYVYLGELTKYKTQGLYLGSLQSYATKHTSLNVNFGFLSNELFLEDLGHTVWLKTTNLLKQQHTFCKMSSFLQGFNDYWNQMISIAYSPTKSYRFFSCYVCTYSIRVGFLLKGLFNSYNGLWEELIFKAH